MKVFSVIDSPPVKKASPNGAGKKTSKKKKIVMLKRENLSPAQIRAKVEKNTAKINHNHKMTKARMEKFKAEKLPDLDEAAKAVLANKKAMAKKGPPVSAASEAKLAEEKMDLAEEKVVGDVGLNDPNDPATHGKLKSVLSMGGFNFSDKERAALENILKD